VKSRTLFLTLFACTAASAWGTEPALLRGPYLQLNTPSSVIVRWRTDIPTDSRVTFGTTAQELTKTAASAELTTEHSVTITGLTPSTRSYYRVGTTAALLTTPDDTCFFETSPVPGAATHRRLWVLGDAGTANHEQLACRDAFNAFAATSGRADLILLLGDNAYPDGKDPEYQKAIFDIYTPTIHNTPMWSCLGNHDGHSADAATNKGPYFDIFDLPKNAEAGGLASGTEAYYSFNYGDIHFVVLDSYKTDRSTSAPMAGWLRRDLLTVNSKWLIAFFHHPPYSKGSHDSDAENELKEMRENFVPILENAGVDLVLSGHSHCYERSKFITGHTGLSTTFDAGKHVVQPGSGDPAHDKAYTKPAAPGAHPGTIYTVSGSAGHATGGTLNHPAMWLSLNEVGSMVIDVEGEKLATLFLNEKGTVRDRFEIVKK
jgi:predicted phosphodiesterase